MIPEDEALETLAREYNIAAPQSMVEEEASMLEQELLCRLRYESLAGRVPPPEEVQAYKEGIPEEAARRVRARLVVEKIIRDRNITVTSEELTSEAQAAAHRQGMTLEQVKDFMGENLALLRREIMERKAIKFARSAGSNQST